MSKLLSTARSRVRQLFSRDDEERLPESSSPRPEEDQEIRLRPRVPPQQEEQADVEEQESEDVVDLQVSSAQAPPHRSTGSRSKLPLASPERSISDIEQGESGSSAAEVDAILRVDPPESHGGRFVDHRFVIATIFGHLLTATDRQTNAKVVIKVSAKALVHSRTSTSGKPVWENPILEANILRRLQNHPHVIGFVDEWSDDVNHYLAVEYLPNGDLFEMLQREGPLAESVVRRLMRQIFSAVAFIHRQGAVHLDISLENVLLDADGNAVLCDFGVAQPLPAPGFCFAGLGHAVKPGKSLYMAPEIVRGGPFEGEACDAFSLGVVLFSLLTACSPFLIASRHKDRRYSMIAEGRFRELLQCFELTDKLSPEAQDLIQRLLSHSPQNRMTPEAALQHPFITGAKLADSSEDSMASSPDKAGRSKSSAQSFDPTSPEFSPMQAGASSNVVLDSFPSLE